MSRTDMDNWSRTYINIGMMRLIFTGPLETCEGSIQWSCMTIYLLVNSITFQWSIRDSFVDRLITLISIEESFNKVKLF